MSDDTDLRIAALEARVAVLEAKASSTVPRPSAPSSGGDVASDRDLDGQYGDPKVKFEPRDWKGASCKGKTFSQCPAEFLDMLADTLEFFGRKNDEKGAVTTSGKPKGEYDRLDARRARGWAKRIRGGWKPPSPYGTSGHGSSAKHTTTPEPDPFDSSLGTGQDSFGGDDIPF